MGRTLPAECEHGRIFDWGDFGGEDSQPESCPDCDVQRVLLRERVGSGDRPTHTEFPDGAVLAVARVLCDQPGVTTGDREEATWILSALRKAGWELQRSPVVGAPGQGQEDGQDGR